MDKLGLTEEEFENYVTVLRAFVIALVHRVGNDVTINDAELAKLDGYSFVMSRSPTALRIQLVPPPNTPHRRN